MPRRSYAIWWHEGDGPRHIGRLELAPVHLLLFANDSRVAIALSCVTRVGYASGELTILRREGAPLRVGSLDAAGALREVGDALAFTPSRRLPSACP